MEIPKLDLSTRQDKQKAAGITAGGVGSGLLLNQAAKTQPVRNASKAVKKTASKATPDIVSKNAAKFNEKAIKPLKKSVSSMAKAVGERLHIVKTTAGVALVAAGIGAIVTAKDSNEA